MCGWCVQVHGAQRAPSTRQLVQLCRTFRVRVLALSCALSLIRTACYVCVRGLWAMLQSLAPTPPARLHACMPAQAIRDRESLLSLALPLTLFPLWCCEVLSIRSPFPSLEQVRDTCTPKQALTAVKNKHSHRREQHRRCGCRRPRRELEACTSCPLRQVRIFLVSFLDVYVWPPRTGMRGCRVLWLCLLSQYPGLCLGHL